MTTEAEAREIGGKLTKAQREALIAVCDSNGGGIRVPTGHENHNYGTPTTHPWKALWARDLIQGKANHCYRVVHTRLGWAVRNILAEETGR